MTTQTANNHPVTHCDITKLASGQYNSLAYNPREPEAQVMKDFDEATSRMAPFMTLACKANYGDYQTGLPLKAFMAVVNELTKNGWLVSVYLKPSHVDVHMDPNITPSQMAHIAPDGKVIFGMFHVLPENENHVRDFTKFIHEAGNDIAVWRAEAGRVS